MNYFIILFSLYFRISEASCLAKQSALQIQCYEQDTILQNSRNCTFHLFTRWDQSTLPGSVDK